VATAVGQAWQSNMQSCSLTNWLAFPTRECEK
jgi:hypothetical protein